MNKIFPRGDESPREETMDFDATAMDQAAADAEKELQEWIKDPAFAVGFLRLASWWSKWYMKAGHKRLGRVVVKFGKAPKES